MNQAEALAKQRGDRAVTVRVGIIDDIPTYRDYFRNRIDDAADLEAAVVVSSIADLLAAIEAGIGVDVVMVDLRLESGVDGPDGVGILAARGLRLLVFSENRDPRVVSDSLAAGAAGYVSKNETPDEILDALRVVAAGDAYISPRFASDLIAGAGAQVPAYRFSEAQLDVLEHVADGLTYDQIARRRRTKPKTVKNQINAIAAHVREVNPGVADGRNPRTFLRDVADELGLNPKARTRPGSGGPQA